MKTSVVLFDAAGVLFKANGAIGEDMEKHFGFKLEDQEPFWKGPYRQLLTGKLTTEEFLDQVTEEFPILKGKATREFFVSSFRDCLEPVDGIRDIIRDLVQAGRKLALLSDTVGMFTDVRHELGYYEHFEKFFLSYEIGYRKPDPHMYQAVIDYYKVPAEEIFFIDDMPKNIEGAKAAGMRGTVFTDADSLRGTLRQEGIL